MRTRFSQSRLGGDMRGLDDFEEILESQMPAGSLAGEAYDNFDRFCCNVEALLSIKSLNDGQLSDAVDAWSRGDTAEAFASRIRGF